MNEIDMMTQCAIDAAPDDGPAQHRLVTSFMAMLNSGGRFTDGMDGDKIRVVTKSGSGNRVNAVAPAYITDAMALCYQLDLYPMPSASPLTPPQMRGDALEIGPNHRGWARLLGRAGITIQPIPVHTKDHVELVDDTVHVRRNPAVRVDEARDLLGVALYVKRDGTRVADHWMPGDTVRKRLGKSKGFAGKEWFAEFAAAAAIRDAIARGVVAIDSAQVDAAMGAGGDSNDEPRRDTKPAVRPADIPRVPDADLPEALRPKTSATGPDALAEFLADLEVTESQVDAWLAAMHPKATPLARATPSQRNDCLGWLDSGASNQLVAWLDEQNTDSNPNT